MIKAAITNIGIQRNQKQQRDEIEGDCVIMGNTGYIKKLISEFAAEKSDVIAFSIYDGQNVEDVCYPQFVDDILKRAGYFVQNNIRNQHIALLSENSYEWIVTFFAVLSSGNIAVLLNPALPVNMIKQLCDQADVTAIWSNFPAEIESTPELASMQWHHTDDLINAVPIGIEEIYEKAPDETLILVGTSGTTGSTKTVEITPRNLQCSIENSPPAEALVGLDKQLLVLPLYHISGVIATTLSLFRKKTMCIGRGMRYIFSDLPVFQPTFISLVPSMMESLEKIYKAAPTAAERAVRTGGKLQRICVAGAAPKRSTCQYLIEQGLLLETGYGMTESAGDGTWCEFTTENIGTIGKPRGSMCCQIQDGEIVFRSDAVMKGYYKDPEETAKIIQDGWLHTGDLGYCDSDGFFYLTGRKKSVIILANGENVNPEEIEEMLSKCADVQECMVYGDGKGICADIYAYDEDAVANYIKKYNEDVPLYRQLYKVCYSAEPLPKTDTGKIKRKTNIY